MQHELINRGPSPTASLAEAVLYWPMWWYGPGLRRVVRFVGHEILAQEERLGLRVWARNLFTPMFGQTDWQGRIISFFIRLANCIGRGIAVAVWAILQGALLLAWICLPLLVIYQLGYQAGLFP